MVAPRAAKPSSPTRFKAGSCVVHQKYGEGRVVTSQMSGGLEQMDVVFPDPAGPETIIADDLRSIEIKERSSVSVQAKANSARLA